jgi:hypothetical protein
MNQPVGPGNPNFESNISIKNGNVPMQTGDEYIIEIKEA